MIAVDANQPETLSVNEAARMAGVGRSTIYAALDGKRPGFPFLPSLKLGKRRLVRREALRNWLVTVERGSAA